ncbi:tannase/feruloyl esterase family alpha/beta hydrolase [Kitasatospora kazusensis]|uniref:Tannase/feruloyl esterase family alpha/beta hydrolase n=1 Tax=Kitasatospora kazusensis TaxID=407974 RepID=A0ABP5LW36_9ACTN
MRRFLTGLAAALPLTAAVYLPSGASASTAGLALTSAGCSAVQVQAPAGTVIESVTAASEAGGTVQGTGVVGGTVADVPPYCNVTLTVTHPGAGDHAKVQVWLPVSGWNGRFQAVGGAAYSAGDNGVGLGTAVRSGYAAATTDAGIGDALDTSWALDGKGRVNTALLENFASRSQHETAIIGKEVVTAFYGQAASYSYFKGCSTGGREGYMEAQRYPDDYNGILADAPAVNWDQFEVATLWPQVVMHEEKTYPTSCEFNAFNQAALKACDGLDGVTDGLISNPDACGYDPARLVGTELLCDGKQVTVTAADAAVVRKIWDGPRSASGKRLWYGLPVGADFSSLAATKPSPDGTLTGSPFVVPAAWVSSFVLKQPSFDTSTLTYSQFTKVFQQARTEYDRIIGTDNPNLTAFRKAGGKLLTWQGDADQLIPTQGTVDYRRRVDRMMGGTQRVDDFYRLFLAPGTAHCGLDGGRSDDLAALAAWVEHGKAPQTLTATLTTATGRTVTRDLCRYPLVSRYSGHGDPAAAASFRCVPADRR